MYTRMPLRRIMSAKIPLPNQCFYLHQYYTPQDCCLCKAREEIEELKKIIAMAKDLGEVAQKLSEQMRNRD